MNADDFKPDDLATIVCGKSRNHSGGSGRHDAALYGPCGDHKRIVREVLASAHVLAPDERAVPKGHVVLDPKDREQVEHLWRLDAREYESKREPQPEEITFLQSALAALAAEQQAAANPVPPEPPHDALVRGDRGMLFEWDSDAELWAGSDGGVGTWGGVVRNYGPVTVYRPDTKAADQ